MATYRPLTDDPRIIAAGQAAARVATTDPATWPAAAIAAAEASGYPIDEAATQLWHPSRVTIVVLATPTGLVRLRCSRTGDIIDLPVEPADLARLRSARDRCLQFGAEVPR